ncbi:hypothetical protein [Sphingomicrobium arenosum]|uniref:hypothetical protein n=1 Tax=Sphingomicrobium arenosum TaxID=2233861 RepID=UPI002240049C|nr:hypothetical protein [Sphingomicrobium arenosum]
MLVIRVMKWRFPRSLMLQVIALCIALGALWAPVAEAAVCAGEPPVALQLKQHKDGDTDETGSEKHEACAHGHCHHSSQAVGRPTESFALVSDVSILRSGTQPTFASNLIELATPPPRA